MDKKKQASVFFVAAALLAFINACIYPTAFIRWIIPLYGLCIAIMIISVFLFFLSLFITKKKKRPVIPAFIGTAIYAAVILGTTPVVNNVIFGSVAPWGSTLVNTVIHFAFGITMILLISKASGGSLKKLTAAALVLVIAGLPVSILTTAPNIKATSFIIFDTHSNYTQRVGNIGIYDNTIETAVPQTDVYTVIENHLKAPAEGKKTEKKVLVLGWDGARADALALLGEDSAVNRVVNDGGKASIAYCGGVNYPGKITQDTSTAPGWCTMLTGVWADKHGINGNGTEKSNDYLTLLTSSVQSGLADKSAFYFSWDGHLTTYKNEIEYIRENQLDVSFVYSDNGDDGTFSKALADISSPDCSDFIFTIFEYCDRFGHEYGFWNDAPEYEEAVKLSSEKGLALIDAIESRETYENEDWLILITSDHGGYVRGHGGETIMERMMFIVTNK